MPQPEQLVWLQSQKAISPSQTPSTLLSTPLSRVQARCSVSSLEQAQEWTRRVVSQDAGGCGCSGSRCRGQRLGEGGGEQQGGSVVLGQRKEVGLILVLPPACKRETLIRAGPGHPPSSEAIEAGATRAS